MSSKPARPPCPPPEDTSPSSREDSSSSGTGPSSPEGSGDEVQNDSICCLGDVTPPESEDELAFPAIAEDGQMSETVGVNAPLANKDEEYLPVAEVVGALAESEDEERVPGPDNEVEGARAAMEDEEVTDNSVVIYPIFPIPSVFTYQYIILGHCIDVFDPVVRLLVSVPSTF